MDPSPPYTGLVLAGGRGARLGGQPKPQLLVGGATMLATVLAAVADAAARVVVGPPQPVPEEVLVVREDPPGGGPVAALRAGLPAVRTDVLVLLAADLPFLTPGTVAGLLRQLDGDGVVVVDDAGRDQYLLGAWRTGALAGALGGEDRPTSLRRLLAPLDVRRWHPELVPGLPPPWVDCDTPDDLARARAVATGLPG